MYSKVLGEFNNMPRSIRDDLTEEEAALRLKVVETLYSNLAICYVKLEQPKEVIKHAEKSLTFNS